jgi:hypothetical protein
MEINDRIFGVLLEVESSVVNNNNFDNDKEMAASDHKNEKESPNLLTNEHIKQMGLDPADDREFLNELIKFYDFKLVINS